MSLSITVEQSGRNELLALIADIENGAEKALYRTLKATQDKAKIEASKKIRTQLKLSKAYVDGHLFVGKPSYSNLSAKLYATKRGILMSRFDHRSAKKGGVDVKIKPTGGYKNLPGAFILPRLKNVELPGIAVREKGKLKVLHAPSVSQVLNSYMPELRDEMAEFAADRLRKEVETIIRRGK